MLAEDPDRAFRQENLAALQTDLRGYKAPAKERAMLELAEAVTIDPEASPASLRAAAKAGWSNEEVAKAVFFVSYFNMVTRIAASMALPPDEMHEFSPDAPLPLLPSE